MPEEKSKKTVDIDTSGPGAEVDVAEEKVKEEKPEDEEGVEGLEGVEGVEAEAASAPADTAGIKEDG